ncbi:MAG: hypothetical protein Fur0037_22090 [Planctomycetota bacterium]
MKNTTKARWHLGVLAAIAAACSSGGGDSGTTGGGDPGTGGGPGGSGGTGNPLAVALEFTVRNEAAAARTETILASVPFPEGGYPTLDRVAVSGHQTAWRVLQRWPDGTVRIGQAQFTDTLAPFEVKTYSVARDLDALQGPFEPNPWVAQFAAGLEIGAEVRDTFSVAYRAVATTGFRVLQETPLCRVRRWRGYHRAGAGQGIGRDYLSSTFYVTEFRDAPFMVVDWIVGNDYRGIDDIPPGNTDPNLRPLGGVDVSEARFLVKGATLALPYRPNEEWIAGPLFQRDGFLGFPVMQDTFLDDAQTRRYRFLLYFEHPSAGGAVAAGWRDTGLAMLDAPLYPLATLRTWQVTEGAGLLGGPIDGPADSWDRAEAEYDSWAGRDQFGTWGSHGDVLRTGTTGTPRNHPLSPELAHAIQAGFPRLLQKLEQMAWIQAVRPYHLWGLTVGDRQDILLWDGVPIYPGSRDLSAESLGRRALYANDPYSAYRTMVQSGSGRAHGWDHFDHEHWSTDLLFDYWTVTGDCWAQEELRQLGQSLKALMRLERYTTSHIQAVRAEGWTMQGFAQAYLATGDSSIKDYALQRLAQTVEVEREKNHPSRALTFQGNYVGTRFPLSHQFYMPWQHGALLYGYLGAYRFFRDPLLLRIAEDVTTAVEYAWVSGYQDPQRGFVQEGLRYYCPVEYNGQPIPANYWDGDPSIGVRWGDSPLGGAHTFLIGGLHLLADWTQDAAVRQRALYYGNMLLGQLDGNGRWNKWNYCVPRHYVQ